jgi:hypothetical protein
VIVGVMPPPVSMIKTCWEVSFGKRRIIGFVVVVVYRNAPCKRRLLEEDWRRLDNCDGTDLFKWSLPSSSANHSSRTSP